SRYIHKQNLAPQATKIARIGAKRSRPPSPRLWRTCSRARRSFSEGGRLRVPGIGAICRPLACSLRLAAQDVALSRRKPGFESPRERHLGYQRNNLQRLEAGTT